MITYDYNNIMRIQKGKGITEKQLDRLVKRYSYIVREIKDEKDRGDLPFMDLPKNMVLARKIEKTSSRLKASFENFVVVGIGGSALGNTALHTALTHPFYNMLPAGKRKGLRIFVLDNVDPAVTRGLLDILDMKKTVVNVISKSGTTAEAMANFMILKKRMQKVLGKKWTKHAVFTTDPEKGYLREIADAQGIETFEVPPGVGGRFSVLSAVGLLSAAVAGINIKRILNGASDMVDLCIKKPLSMNPAFMNALIHYYLDTEKGDNIAVMMSYSNKLLSIADWYRQLLAESIGKADSLEGKKIYCGPTPVKALGATDQHSQVQLYREGPFDKVFTFLKVMNFKQDDIAIPADFKDKEGLEYLGGKKLSFLINSELEATKQALVDSHRPNCTIELPEITPEYVGQLLMMLEIQIAYAGKLYKVNPFNQPGVEAGKIMTYALMGRKGYQRIKQDLVKKIAVRKKFII